MELTQEQKNIIDSVGNIKINAVAGSGKTTTVIEYAKARPSTTKILYLAFNKSVKLEAAKKFADKGLQNVTVETAHSLAYRHIVYHSQYKVRAQGYKTNEIVELLNLQGNEERHTEYVIANHINKLIALFCNSDKTKVHAINYLETVSDTKAKAFVNSFYNYILGQSRLLLSKMDKGEIEITHDFYLKKFQLSNPILPYDYILFDEAQDASPAMLDTFLKQQATKVIVGDTHQQIYGWRFAVNSLEKADFKTLHLSTSFRFGQDIANLAMEALKLKIHLGLQASIPITGQGNNTKNKTKAILARTNLGLLLRAIEYVTENQKTKGIYFEGNINSYTYADEGASLYDVLHLYNKKHHLIRDKLIKSMQDLDDLVIYIEKTEDIQLSIMIEIVRKYENEIPDLIKTLKEKHITNDDKESAEIIFSTVHRSKGMEYDTIELVNDFISEEKLKKQIEKNKEEQIDTTKLNEEINLLYVAITRTKNIINIPESLVKNGFPKSKSINILKVTSEEEKKSKISLEAKSITESKKENAYSVKEIRKKHSGANQPWTPELDIELTALAERGKTIIELAKHFGRTKCAISSRINKLAME